MKHSHIPTLQLHSAALRGVFFSFPFEQTSRGVPCRKFCSNPAKGMTASGLCFDLVRLKLYEACVTCVEIGNSSDWKAAAVLAWPSRPDPPSWLASCGVSLSQQAFREAHLLLSPRVFSSGSVLTEQKFARQILLRVAPLLSLKIGWGMHVRWSVAYTEEHTCCFPASCSG